MSGRRSIKARDKIALKNTRDGLALRNAATGEDVRISKREADFDLRGDEAERKGFSQVGKRPQTGASANKSKRKQVYRNGKSKHTPETDTAASHASPLVHDAPTALETSAAQKTIAEQAITEQADNSTDTPQSRPDTPADIPRSLNKPPGGAEKLNTAQMLYADALREPAKSGTPLKHERESALSMDRNDTAQPAAVSNKPQTKTKRQPADNCETQPDTPESVPANENTAAQSPAPPNTPKDKPDSVLKTDKAGKLQFTQDEAAPDDAKPRRLMKAERQMERTTAKLEKAQEHLPAKRKLHKVSVTDEQTGNVSRRLRFEKTPVSQSEHMKGSLPLRSVKAGTNALMLNAHRKIYQVEHENVGVKAAHRAEMAAKGGIRAALHFRKTAPYKRVEKLERAARKKSINLSYQRALAENPKLKSNMLSRAFQKRKIKKDYAKATREAQKAAKQAKKAGSAVSQASKALIDIVKRHPVATAAVVLIALLLFALMSLVGVFGGAGSGAFGGILTASYLAEDADIDNAEVAYTEWETDLLMEIANTESNRPGYDEYRYNVGDISHNPYELMAYLTVVYQNFPFGAIESDLRALFAEQYSLIYTPTTETRYADPTDSNDDGDYEPYEWTVLTVTLTARSFTDVVLSHLSGEQMAHYALLLQTKGSRQYVGNPFAGTSGSGDMNWLPYVTSYYGYRVHPISEEKDLHRAVDIGLAEGTEIQSVQDGTVTFAGYSGGYGNVVIIENDKGIVSKYAHCAALLVSAGQTVSMGDVIATVGNTGNSTGSHLHLELLKDGLYLNPLFFIDSGSFNLAPVYGNAGAPLGDGSYAALIAEAESHLGKSYVWGASGPNSFDCSGLICYVYRVAGVYDFGRITANDIYNRCDPVSPDEARPGDIVTFHSTYSTAKPISHIGIYVGEVNGRKMMLHAGSPVQYTYIDTPYWQEHLYGFARIPSGITEGDYD